MALHQIGVKAKSYTASQISMRTTDSYSKAKILDVDGKKIQDAYQLLHHQAPQSEHNTIPLDGCVLT